MFENKFWKLIHRENGGGPCEMVALTTPYTPYIVGIYWGPYPLLKGSLGGIKQLGSNGPERQRMREQGVYNHLSLWTPKPPQNRGFKPPKYGS